MEFVDTQYDEETMDYFYNVCEVEDIYSQLLSILKELNKIIPRNPKNTQQIGKNISVIVSKMDKTCLLRLSGNLSIQLPAIANQMEKQAVFGEQARRCIPEIEKVLNFLRDEFSIVDEPDESDESEESQEPEAQEPEAQEPEKFKEVIDKPTLFPSHKYLDLSSQEDFPNIKSKYKELSLLYHPDKCPNKNTPNMTKKQCEEEFKILNSEYNIIKQEFGISGGKKRIKIKSKKRKTKRYSKKKMIRNGKRKYNTKRRRSI